jgi:hypothetical protein
MPPPPDGAPEPQPKANLAQKRTPKDTPEYLHAIGQLRPLPDPTSTSHDAPMEQVGTTTPAPAATSPTPNVEDPAKEGSPQIAHLEQQLTHLQTMPSLFPPGHQTILDLQAKITQAKLDYKPVPTAKIQASLLANKASWDQWLDSRRTAHAKKVNDIDAKIEALKLTRDQAEAVMKEDTDLHQAKMTHHQHMMAQVPIAPTPTHPHLLNMPCFQEIAPLLQDPNALPNMAASLAEHIRNTESIEPLIRQQVAALLNTLPACAPYLFSFSPTSGEPTPPTLTQAPSTNTTMPTSTTPLTTPTLQQWNAHAQYPAHLNSIPTTQQPTTDPSTGPYNLDGSYNHQQASHNEMFPSELPAIPIDTPPASTMGEQLAELIAEEESLLASGGRTLEDRQEDRIRRRDPTKSIDDSAIVATKSRAAPY